MTHRKTHGQDLGGTELLRPLQSVLQAPLEAGRTRQVFVLTDGEVSNTSQVIEEVRRYTDRARVFALGLGHGASHELVEGIGWCVFMAVFLYLNGVCILCLMVLFC